MNEAEFQYLRFDMEDLLPSKGTAKEVAESIYKNPKFVEAIQRGIDKHEPGVETDPKNHMGGKGFKQSIVLELIGGVKQTPSE